jgi:hypothetical protein
MASLTGLPIFAGDFQSVVGKKRGQGFLKPYIHHTIPSQCEPLESCNEDDTTRYPRTMVSFAIVMLGTGVERYALPVLLWPICSPPLLLYEDYLDNRLCSRLDYGRC